MNVSTPAGCKHLARIAVATVFCLLGVGLAASASANDDPTCREECEQARRTCRRAAHVTHSVCRERCATHTQAAVERAREICLRQNLPEEECARVVAQAVEAALQACHGECREVAQRARAVCSEQRRECIATCAEDIDPECGTPCLSQFAECRDELGSCLASCPEARKAAFQECHAMADRESNPAGLRECLQEARQAARECKSSCHAELPCGSDLHACLGECVEVSAAE